MDFNTLEMNLLVTLLVAVLVFLLPWADRKICRRLKLNLEGGLSENPDADRILRIRQRILALGIVLYMLLFAWLVFFSRSSTGDYTVHVAPLEDLKNAFSTPTGFSGWFRTLFTEGFASAFSQISIVRPEDLSQFYLNMMLFVPMGYLLPYVFRWFRARVRVRPVLFCLLLSFAVENLQLMTRRGMYDFDDIISNTLGGLTGQLLYIAVGYVVTHPSWRRDLREYRAWKRRAHRTTLFPYTKKTGMFRTTLRGSDQAKVYDFYMNRLGFRLRQELNRRESGDVVLLFEMGKNQVQVICTFREAMPDRQYLTLYAMRLPAVRRRLEENGIAPGDYRRDPCTGQRLLRFSGPDNVCVEIVEAD
jgi:hypothetical protein